MPTTEEILNAYMVQDADIPDEVYYPQHIEMNLGRVTPLVEGSAYFAELSALIDSLGNGNATENAKQGIYIAGWAFYPFFSLTGTGPTLLDKLVEKAQARVDVRILVWVNSFIMASPFPVDTAFDIVGSLGRPHEAQQAVNLSSIEYMRSHEVAGEFPFADRIIVNTLDNPVGACHLKFSLVFTDTSATGFTGGIDLEPGRYSDDHHALEFQSNGGDRIYNLWHDVEAKVEGQATDEMFSHFRNMWNECIRRRDDLAYNPTFILRNDDDELPDSKVEACPAGAEEIPMDKVIGVTSGRTNHRVQVLRTIPKVNFLLWSDPEISFAPEGAYEIELAVKKAIRSARKYIYIEDQAMLSREIFGALREAVTRTPGDGSANELRVILVTGVSDPADPPKNSRAIIFLSLLDGLTDEQKDRIVYYNHNQATIHSKVFIVDDAVAIIGSAGMFNRALYTEWEHAVSFVDTSGAGNAVADFRQRLWGEVFCLPESDRDIGTLDQALAMWKPGWGTGTPSDALPREADRVSELWGGTWKFVGPVLMANGPKVADAAAGRLPSLTGELLIPEYDPATDAQLTVTDTDGGTTTTVGVYRDHRGNRGTPSIDPDGLVVDEVPGLPPATVSSVIDEHSIAEDWIPDPEMNHIPDPEVLKGYVAKLRGGFILCTGGPNQGYLRRIIHQEQGRLTFEPFPNTVDSSFTYAIVLPRVERTDLPESLSIFETWREFLWQFFIYDIGGTQWFAGRRKWDQLELEGDVGDGPPPVNKREDVMKVQARLAQLGFDWVRIDGDAGAQTRKGIRIFQAMTQGDEVVGPGHQDGRVDHNGETLKWLNAANPPRWGLMPTGSIGQGFINVEVTAQPHDRHDWGSSWTREMIVAAGAAYRRSWLSSHPNATPLAINDVALWKGGNTTDHEGHEAGLQVDIRLARTDGATTGTSRNAASYDQDSMRAMLQAIRNSTPTVTDIFFNDPVLISAGLCTAKPGHDNRVHVAVGPQERRN